jgi:predicted nucleic acid-binding protein
MRTLFVDTGYYVSVLNPQDDLHDRAISVSRSLDDCIFVTTEMVLTELLNFFAERGAAPRQLAADFVHQIRQDPNTRIIPQTSAQFEDAFKLYRRRTIRSGATRTAPPSALWSKQALRKHFRTIATSSRRGSLR